MSIYTLYLKVHKITGLRYLGQTKKDPFIYQGSGTDWIEHIQKYGYEVRTEILLQTNDRNECNNLGRYYSKLWDVVRAQDDYGNKIYANRIPETGGAGPISDYTKKLLSIGKMGNTHGFKKKNTHGRLNGFKPGNTEGFKIGSANPNYDSCKYTWYHSGTGKTITLTRAEFIKQYNMNRGAISRLINNDPSVLTVKGWKIIKSEAKPHFVAEPHDIFLEPSL